MVSEGWLIGSRGVGGCWDGRNCIPGRAIDLLLSLLMCKEGACAERALGVSISDEVASFGQLGSGQGFLSLYRISPG